MVEYMSKRPSRTKEYEHEWARSAIVVTLDYDKKQNTFGSSFNVY